MTYKQLFLLSLLLRYIGSLGIFSLALYVSKHWWNRLGVKTFMAYYLLRVIVLWAFCRLGGTYPGDLPEWYTMSRWIVDDHLVPGITCLTGYHLGFSYVLALSSFLWKNPLSIALPWTLCEMAAMGLFHKSLKELYSPAVANRSIILYLGSPFCLLVSWMGAQDETFYLLMAAIFLRLYIREAGWIIHTLVSFTAVFLSKLVVPLFLVPFTLLKRWRTLTPFVLGLIFYYGICLAIGHNPFDMRTTRDMSDMRTLSMLAFETQLGNIWYFIPGPVLLQNVVLLFALVLSGLSLYPGFCDKSEKGLIFEHAIVLHITWFLSFALLFRINFVQYLLPLSFYLSFHLATRQTKDNLGGYGHWIIIWTVIFFFKDFVNNVLGFQKLILVAQAPFLLDIYSILCLLSGTTLLAMFLYEFRCHFQSPWTGFRKVFGFCT